MIRGLKHSPCQKLQMILDLRFRGLNLSRMVKSHLLSPLLVPNLLASHPYHPPALPVPEVRHQPPKALRLIQ